MRAGSDSDDNGSLSAGEVDRSIALCANQRLAFEFSGTQQIRMGRDRSREGRSTPTETNIYDGGPGRDGVDGAAGADGVTTLVSVSAAEARLCEYGGIAIAAGRVLDRDGVLDPAEVETSAGQVCNGAPGVATLSDVRA